MERISFCRYIQQSQQYSIYQKGKDSFTLESKLLLRPKPSKGIIGLGSDCDIQFSRDRKPHRYVCTDEYDLYEVDDRYCCPPCRRTAKHATVRLAWFTRNGVWWIREPLMELGHPGWRSLPFVLFIFPFCYHSPDTDSIAFNSKHVSFVIFKSLPQREKIWRTAVIKKWNDTRQYQT